MVTEPRKYSAIGDTNLMSISEAKNFTNWMYSEIKPYLRGEILEVGSGNGTYSEKIIRDFGDNTIFLSDVDIKYLKKLKRAYFRKNVKIIKLDLDNQGDFTKIGQKFKSILMLNVLEHIKDDKKVLSNLFKILQDDGTLVILVPAYRSLYNCIDKSVGHYRRYDIGTITKMSKETGFRIQEIYYFNFLSILGWYVNGRIFKNPKLNIGALRIYDKLIFIARAFERYILRKKIGLSIIVVLKKY